jgi:hypothetical protein
VNYEIELNEAWILDKSAGDTQTPAGEITHIQHVTERYPSGKVKATWSAGRTADGRILLEGKQQFFYPSGKPMWTVTFHAGKKTGEERYQREDGTSIWVKNYSAGGTWTWHNFDEHGKQTAESRWRGKTLESSDVPENGPFDKIPGADKLGPPPGE